MKKIFYAIVFVIPSFLYSMDKPNLQDQQQNTPHRKLSGPTHIKVNFPTRTSRINSEPIVRMVETNSQPGSKVEEKK